MRGNTTEPVFSRDISTVHFADRYRSVTANDLGAQARCGGDAWVVGGACAVVSRSSSGPSVCQAWSRLHSRSRLGFALMLRFFEIEDRFRQRVGEMPPLGPGLAGGGQYQGQPSAPVS